jgi:hypothetical protein
LQSVIAMRVVGVVLLTMLLAAAPDAGAAVPHFHAPIAPARDPAGRVVRGHDNQVNSANWSGYAETNSQTGLTYTSAGGTWDVPRVSPVSGFSEAYSSAWVGIGGQCEDPSCVIVDTTLIQLGTESDVSSSGVGTYYSWYEALPQPPIKIPLAVHPGDVILAGLAMTQQTTVSQTWALGMLDQTTGGAWSTTLSYQSSLRSAEWIVEAPGQVGSILPLANFGIMQFDLLRINGLANPSLQPSEAIFMGNPAGMASIPGKPDADTDGFLVCWTPPTGTSPCSIAWPPSPPPPPPPPP